MALCVLFLISCSDTTEEINPTTTADLSQEFEGIFSDESNGYVFKEVAQIDGKTVVDYREEWQRNFDYDIPVGSACLDTPPDCTKRTMNWSYNLSPNCTIDYSFDLYICGTGNVGIYNFQMAPQNGSSCPEFASMMALQTAGDLSGYQATYNAIVAQILSGVEDWLSNFASSLFVGNQLLVVSSIPNICAATCGSGGTQVVCGIDCCWRYVVLNNATQTRSTFAFSLGECGGDTFTCNNEEVDCENLNCTGLDVYTP